MGLSERYLEILMSSNKEHPAWHPFIGGMRPRSRHCSIIDLARVGSSSARDAVLEYVRQYEYDFVSEFWKNHLVDNAYHPYTACVRLFDCGSKSENVENFEHYLWHFLLHGEAKCQFEHTSFVFQSSRDLVLKNLDLIIFSKELDTPNNKALSKEDKRALIFERAKYSINATGWLSTPQLVFREFLRRTTDSRLFEFLALSSYWHQLIEEEQNSPFSVLLPKSYSFQNLTGQVLEQHLCNAVEALNEAATAWGCLRETADKMKNYALIDGQQVPPIAMHFIGRLCALANFAVRRIDEIERKIEAPHPGFTFTLVDGLHPSLRDQHLNVEYYQTLSKIKDVAASLDYLVQKQPKFQPYKEFHETLWLVDQYGGVREHHDEGNLYEVFSTPR